MNRHFDIASSTGEFRCCIELGFAQLQHQGSPTAEPMTGTADQDLCVFEASGPCEQGVDRFPLGYDCREFLVVTDIGRIRDDHIEVPFTFRRQCFEPVAMSDLDPGGRTTKARGIRTGGRNRVDAPISADHLH